MFVKPAEGRVVRRPDTRKYLLEEGEEVPRDSFWTRRLLDGDVVKSEAPPEADEPTTAKPELVERATPDPVEPEKEILS